VDYAIGARFAKIPFFKILNKKLRLVALDWNEKIFIHDLTKKFPWPDNSAQVIYSSHCLEHFSREDGLNFLCEAHRVLQKDGII
jgi:predicted SAM-dependent methyltransferase